ncbi:MAG: GNAT family N-acetyltransferase [Muribaculaceae bacterium]|nr:GNAT family N-acetyltransferase [Muribaculaceae bacterium]
MPEIRLERYSSDRKEEWDAFADNSRNATFLLRRGYMDYHSDRFEDHSLMFYKGGRLTALLPANLTDNDEEGKILHSHSGLTYGGLIIPATHFDVRDMLEIFDLIREYAKSQGISGLDYKPIPHIYSGLPSEEDRYALFRNGAVRTECGISSAVDTRSNPGFNSQQKRNLKRGIKEGLTLREHRDVGEFHALLTECLRERHGVAPVHTLAELQLLKDRFPENIRIFTADGESGAEAGVCVYLCGRVAHAQYICSSGEGRAKGAPAFLFDHLIGQFSTACDYFDFGISTEEHGRILNEGLYAQKTGLGGRGVVYERYYVDFGK